MSPPPLPPAHTIHTLPPTQQTCILDLLFEPSSTLHSLILPLFSTTSPIPTYPSLISLIRSTLLTLSSSSNPSDISKLDSILGAHPRLGEKKVDSELSRNEQRAMREASGLSEMEWEKQVEEIREGNRCYEERFPGLRFVVFVNGRPRSEILEIMKARIERGDINEERREAIEAMCDIANDRAKKLQQQSSS